MRYNRLVHTDKYRHCHERKDIFQKYYDQHVIQSLTCKRLGCHYCFWIQKHLSSNNETLICSLHRVFFLFVLNSNPFSGHLCTCTEQPGVQLFKPKTTTSIYLCYTYTRWTRGSRYRCWRWNPQARTIKRNRVEQRQMLSVCSLRKVSKLDFSKTKRQQRLSNLWDLFTFENKLDSLKNSINIINNINIYIQIYVMYLYLSEITPSMH